MKEGRSFALFGTSFFGPIKLYKYPPPFPLFSPSFSLHTYNFYQFLHSSLLSPYKIVYSASSIAEFRLSIRARGLRVMVVVKSHQEKEHESFCLMESIPTTSDKKTLKSQKMLQFLRILLL
ncbi:unnamed protein product [Lactuca virosa]|uniref:Uncharacterized protein n=1 Tax=Lactuca virosa TaxID=75947 RepID=A0AAU9PLY7_9ASTR|nr:unnamed protein product [Lactuca virosa]